MFAASAIAANTFLRSSASAGFPLFATYMIERMGVQNAGTLLGCVAFAQVSLPVHFWLRGGCTREKSTFALTFPVAKHAGDVVSESDVEKDGKAVRAFRRSTA